MGDFVTEELNDRQQKVLDAIISEYVATAVPVGSDTIVRKHRMGVSPATVRNAMVALESTGYIYHPHTSAGRVPSDKGYRFFVEHLMQPTDLSADERRTISHQFHQVELALDEWLQLAAAVLAHITHNTAVVTLPVLPHCRLKHLDLVPIQGQLALLIVVVHEGIMRKQIVGLGKLLALAELETLAHKLCETFEGKTAGEIERYVPEGPTATAEIAIRDAIAQIMLALDEQGLQNMWYDGITQMLNQPEFGQPERLRDLLEILQQRSSLATVLTSAFRSEGINLVIGEENAWPLLRGCSVVVTRYGAPGELGGAIGVLGPTRMRYDRVISSVRFVSGLLSDLWQDVYA